MKAKVERRQLQRGTNMHRFRITIILIIIMPICISCSHSKMDVIPEHLQRAGWKDVFWSELENLKDMTYVDDSTDYHTEAWRQSMSCTDQGYSMLYFMQLWIAGERDSFQLHLLLQHDRAGRSLAYAIIRTQMNPNISNYLSYPLWMFSDEQKMLRKEEVRFIESNIHLIQPIIDEIIAKNSK